MPLAYIVDRIFVLPRSVRILCLKWSNPLNCNGAGCNGGSINHRALSCIRLLQVYHLRDSQVSNAPALRDSTLVLLGESLTRAFMRLPHVL